MPRSHQYPLQPSSHGVTSTRRRRSRGWLTVELGVAATLVIIMTVAFSRMASHIHDARAAQHQRRVAIQCLQNIAQQLFAVPQPELSDQAFADLQLPGWAAEALPGGQLTVQRLSAAATMDEEIVARIAISWNSRTRQRVETTLVRYALPSDDTAGSAEAAGEVVP